MIEDVCRIVSKYIVKNGLGQDVEKVGHFILDNDTPLHIVKAMLFDFTKAVADRERDIIATQQAAKQVEIDKETAPADAVASPEPESTQEV